MCLFEQIDDLKGELEMSVYLLVLFAAICIGGVGTGLILLDHHLEEKRDAEKKAWIRETMIPAVRFAMTELIDDCMDKVMDKTVEMTRKMMNVDDD